MQEYALFPGCMIPLRLPNLELSLRALFKRLDIGLVDMKEAGCCPDVSIKSVDQDTWTILAARNLSIAEGMDLKILTMCNGCFGTLKTIDTALKGNEKLKARVNERLATVGRKYAGKTEVKHLVEALANDIGLEKLADAIEKPLKGLRVAAHYGCHLIRPNSSLELDDPLRPVILDKLIEVTGAFSVPYYKKNLCCGALVSGVDPETGKGLVRYKLEWLNRAKADCMSVVCPSCMLQYDVIQNLVRKDSGERFNLPVFYYPELLLLAMGAEPKELAFDMHKTKTDSVLEKVLGSA